MKLEKIKLIIWDLDDTFWAGTLSEGDVTPIKENLDLVREFTDIGIINSINSKNDMELVEKKLEEYGIRECFVFLSVNWEPKGQRIKEQIEVMRLRPQNVLFIDDNHLNIEEAKFYNPGIMTATPENLSLLYEDVKKAEKKDKEHKRLKQYQLLEIKSAERTQSSSNNDFLYNSNIKVKIDDDCLNQIERIHDMILRTNQLNFTKKRILKAELIELLMDGSYKSGYVSVTDRFGDYGIIGFYACKNIKLEHFLFSCRTLGMGIEQYVYAQLNYPQIEVSGEVISELTDEAAPGWINHETRRNKDEYKFEANGAKVLFKGPCDLQQIFSYIKETEGIDCEFTYVNEETGVLIEQHNHTCQIVEGLTLSQEQKDRLIRELPFSHKEMFLSKLFKKPYDVVFLSMLTDGNLGVYRRKETGELIAFGEYYYPLTDQNNWDGYVNGSIFNANCKLTFEALKEFSDRYEYVSRVSVQQMIENLRFIHDILNPDTFLVLMIGVETPYDYNSNPAYEGRHLIHREMNAAIREFAKEHTNVGIIDFNSYVNGQKSFYNNINHFIKPVYYNMAKDIIMLIKSKTNIYVQQKSRLRLVPDYLKQVVRQALARA